MNFRKSSLRSCRSIIALIAFVALAGSSLLANMSPVSATFSCQTDLNPAHVGADSTTFPTDPAECESENPCGEGHVLWHFVLVQTTSGGLSSQLYVVFDSSGAQTVTASKYVGGVIHWNVCTPTDDTLTFACTDATGAILNLSHVCGGGGGGGAAQTTITTQVHLGATDTGTPIVVDNCNGANAPATVHDSALLTASPTVTLLPAGSFVTFVFFNNNSCSGEPVASTSIDVGGQSTPLTLDPNLVRGPLAAGCYSYNASFTSGNTALVLNDVGDCEPFCVYNAPLTPGYWKTHLAPISSTCTSKQGCSNNGPWTITCLPKNLGNYVVATTAQATAVWNNMNCSASSDNDALGCLAGHLLAAQLNRCNASSPCIDATIAAANLFLANLGYAGPGGTYTLTASQRAEAIALKNALDTYNNGGGCPPGSTCQ